MAEVGKYTKAKKRGYKVAGLSAKQMEKATTLKGKKLTAGQKTKASKLTDISKTKWVEGKGVVGPKGKAFTGSVILPNGKTASYVNGRRVGVNTKKSATAPSASRTKTTTTKKANATLSTAQKAKLIKDKKIAAGMGAKSSVSRGQSAAGSRYSAQGKATSSKPSTGASSGKSWWQAGGGGLVGPNSPFSPGPSRSKPQKGDRRPHGPYGGYETYNGSRWIRDKSK